MAGLFTSMPQIVLGPTEPSQGTVLVSSPLSNEERRLQRVLDPTIPRPGDLVLASSIVPTFIPRQIRAVQMRGGYPVDDARWEHAAIFIGKGQIVEATRKGVHTTRLSRYFETHLLRFRRDERISLIEGYELAIEALTYQDYRYSFLEIFRLLLRARGAGFANKAKEGFNYPKQTLICSQLYADSYSAITGRVIGNHRARETTPASLSMSKQLQDVQLRWLTP